MSIRNPNPIRIIHAQREPVRGGQRRLDGRRRSNGLLLIRTFSSLLVTRPESDLIRSEHVTDNTLLDWIGSQDIQAIAPPMALYFVLLLYYNIKSRLARERDMEIVYEMVELNYKSSLSFLVLTPTVLLGLCKCK
jgi:hypothetical protein